MIPFIMPYRIDRRFERTPFVTIALIAITVVVFAATIGDLESVVKVLGFRMNASGLLYGWFTAMFLHAGFQHIAGNMFFLWLFGSYIEDVLGWKAYLVTYVVGGFAAAVTHGLLTALFDLRHLAIPSVGASGALAAVMGLFMVRFYKTKMKFAMCWPFFPFWKWRTFAWTSLLGIGLWFAQEVADGILATAVGGDGVAHWAHVGGLLFGAALGVLSGQRAEADTEYLAEEAHDASIAGDSAMAAVKYAQLSERIPTDPEVLLGKATSELSAGLDPSIAAEDLRQAVELLMTQGRRERVLLAAEELRQVLPNVPVDVRTLSAMGSVAESSGRSDLASELYWRLVQEHPDTREAERSLFRLAHMYQSAGMSGEASETWRRFRTRFPQSEWLPYAEGKLAEAG